MYGFKALHEYYKKQELIKKIGQAEYDRRKAKAEKELKEGLIILVISLACLVVPSCLFDASVSEVRNKTEVQTKVAN